MTTPDRFQTATQLARVWRNECLRVLYDRLIDTQDRKFVDVCFPKGKICYEIRSFRKNYKV